LLLNEDGNELTNRMLTQDTILAALAQASYEEIQSEYKRRIAGLRKTKSGGSRWSKHVPDAPRGCRCGRCIAARKRRKPEAA
jgi:hypothetical protein